MILFSAAIITRNVDTQAAVHYKGKLFNISVIK